MEISEFFGWIGTIIGLIGLDYAVYTSYISSKQVSELNNQLKQSQQVLLSTFHSDIREVQLSIYEVNTIGIDEETRDKIFQNRFGFTYSKVKKILECVNGIDDFSLGISSLEHEDFKGSLSHFNLDLIKNPSNIESKVGKSAALIELKQTIEARALLFEIEPVYKDKAYFEKLLGDSFYNEADFKNATDHYLKSLKQYFTTVGFKDNNYIQISTKICIIKYNGLYDSPAVFINKNVDGWCGVISFCLDNGESVTITCKLLMG